MRASNLESCSAAVGDFAGGFAEEEALLGSAPEEAATPTFLHEGGIVEFGIEPEKRQGEAVLAARLPVTGTGVAPEAGEERLNVEFECDGGRAGCH